MKRRTMIQLSQLAALSALLLSVVAGVAVEPTQGALSAFDSYVRTVEARLDAQHQAQGTFLAGPAGKADVQARLRRGEVVIEKLTPDMEAGFPDAMLHHWRGSAFAPGATVADFENLMRDFPAYPRHFAPQVLRARMLAGQGDRIHATMRVRQQHILTVVMDTDYDLSFGRLDADHGYSFARSTRVAEISAAGTAQERVLGPSAAHGFLWRLNTYWSCEERDGGLYMQIESVSLTRSIPRGLGWAIGPFVESVPRESLEFTLRSASKALRR